MAGVGDDNISIADHRILHPDGSARNLLSVLLFG
jgi:hypothetical protein